MPLFSTLHIFQFLPSQHVQTPLWSLHYPICFTCFSSLFCCLAVGVENIHDFFYQSRESVYPHGHVLWKWCQVSLVPWSSIGAMTSFWLIYQLLLLPFSIAFYFLSLSHSSQQGNLPCMQAWNHPWILLIKRHCNFRLTSRFDISYFDFLKLWAIYDSTSSMNLSHDLLDSWSTYPDSQVFIFSAFCVFLAVSAPWLLTSSLTYDFLHLAWCCSIYHVDTTLKYACSIWPSQVFHSMILSSFK